MFTRRINAHLGAALAVDWHPDGHHIASCGRDRKIKVSLFTPPFMHRPLQSRLQETQSHCSCTSQVWSERKIVHSFSAIQGVSRIQWRPDHPDEIASCSMNSDCRIFIWDVRKPYVASCFFEEHEETPTGNAICIWHNILSECSPI